MPKCEKIRTDYRRQVAWTYQEAADYAGLSLSEHGEAEAVLAAKTASALDLF